MYGAADRDLIFRKKERKKYTSACTSWRGDRSMRNRPGIYIASFHLFHLTNQLKGPGELEMEAAVGAANWVVGMVLNKLSDELMAGYMASRELGLNMDQIKRDLSYMLALLQAAEGRDIADNLGLQRLLADLCNKADEAEDVLDELHYFVIRDELDGTREATPDLGDGLGAQLQHARHAARNTAAGNYWLSCFSSCCRSQSQQDDTVTVVTGNNRNTSMAISKTDEEHDQSGASGHIQESLFDRVAMSKKIKSLIQDVHSLCPPISDLLQKNP